jgi:proteasome lid subunit RPN8/RPN11
VTEVDEELFTIAVYPFRADAEIALARLSADGIAAVIRQDDEGGLNPGFFKRYGVRVEVSVDDVQDARESLGIEHVHVPRPVFDAMFAHSGWCRPNEACGLVAFDGDGPAFVFCLTNTDQSGHRFTIDWSTSRLAGCFTVTSARRRTHLTPISLVALILGGSTSSLGRSTGRGRLCGRSGSPTVRSRNCPSGLGNRIQSMARSEHNREAYRLLFGYVGAGLQAFALLMVLVSFPIAPTWLVVGLAAFVLVSGAWSWTKYNSNFMMPSLVGMAAAGLWLMLVGIGVGLMGWF